jgi:hypothetical protein
MRRIVSLPAALISIIAFPVFAVAADDPMMKQAQDMFQPVPAKAPDGGAWKEPLF